MNLLHIFLAHTQACPECNPRKHSKDEYRTHFKTTKKINRIRYNLNDKLANLFSVLNKMSEPFSGGNRYIIFIFKFGKRMVAPLKILTLYISVELSLSTYYPIANQLQSARFNGMLTKIRVNGAIIYTYKHLRQFKYKFLTV